MSIDLTANGPVTSIRCTVEKHTAPAVHNAAVLAAVEQAKVAAARQAQQTELERFNHELQLRVEEAERAKREQVRKLARLSANKVASAAAAAKERAVHHAAKQAAPPTAPPTQNRGTQLDVQRQVLQEAAHRATQMMLQLHDPDEDAPGLTRSDSAAGASKPVAAVPPAPSPVHTMRVVQAAADRAVAHERRMQLEEATRQARRASVEAHKAAAWRLEQTSFAQDEALQQATEQLAERAARQAVELQAEKREQAQAQDATQTARYIEALRHQLKLEVALRPRPLPPLCACGLDPLENHPALCARNCGLYQNPAGYSRALSGLIARTIKLETIPCASPVL